MGLMTKWTDGESEAPAPIEGNIVATVTTGTIVWLVALVVQLPFYGWYADHGHTWFLWTCATGAGLGLVGLWYVRQRERGLRRAAAEAGADAGASSDAGTEEGEPSPRDEG